MDQGYPPIAILDEDDEKVPSVKVDNRDPVALIDAVAARGKGCDVAVEATRDSSLRLGIEGNEVAKLQGRTRPPPPRPPISNRAESGSPGSRGETNGTPNSSPSTTVDMMT
jgi:hypothetical protein